MNKQTQQTKKLIKQQIIINFLPDSIFSENLSIIISI